MNFENQWAITEERLAREADSLGELLEALRSRISPILIGDDEWKRLVDRGRELPATLAAYPFGLELPLHEQRPGADLGVSVVGGTGPAAFFQRKARSESADSYANGIARLLSETESEESALRQIVGHKMMLEYDVDTAPVGAHPEPGIFLRPAERPILGGDASQRVADIGVVLDALTAAVGWNLDPSETRRAEEIYRALGPATKIESFGAFPARERAIRLAVTGFRTSSDLMAFLHRAGWPGGHSFLAATLSRFEERSAFVNLGVNLDVLAEGLGPTLGLSVLAKDREPKDPGYWVDRPGQWTPFMESLRDEGLGLEEKLTALADWTRGPATLFGKSGPFILMRGIHHVKFVLAEDRFKQIKAYVFMLFLGTAFPGAGPSR
ncbi:MAG: hypothetical protein OXG29_06890 [Gammaproteobacteria bacterium]|nr:hypothetical protein [Gammaproteobacteria bacterium]MCY3989396.1 hypothetical protein [Gammaproteobacteria bacterium]